MPGDWEMARDTQSPGGSIHPPYERDPSFRKNVSEKLSVSGIEGVVPGSVEFWRFHLECSTNSRNWVPFERCNQLEPVTKQRFMLLPSPRKSLNVSHPPHDFDKASAHLSQRRPFQQRSQDAENQDGTMKPRSFPETIAAKQGIEAEKRPRLRSEKSWWTDGADAYVGR